jgi:hypothetical protein
MSSEEEKSKVEKSNEFQANCDAAIAAIGERPLTPRNELAITSILDAMHLNLLETYHPWSIYYFML